MSYECHTAPLNPRKGDGSNPQRSLGVAMARLRVPDFGRKNLLLLLPALAGAAAFIAWKVRRAEAEHPPRGRFIEVDGVRLHYLDCGFGDPIVLLHGLGVNSADFEISGLVGEASLNHRVIAFDRPGHGYSERPRGTWWTPMEQARLLRKALKQLNVERPVVLGHSWGALVALSLALQYPDDVKSLVLVSGVYFPTLRLDAPLLSLPAVPLAGDLLRFTLFPVVWRAFWPVLRKWLFSPARVTPGFRNFPAWLSLKPGSLRASAAESALAVPSALALSRHYRELRVPTFIVAGADDRYVSAERHSARLHDVVKGSHLRLAPHAGHMVHHVAPLDVWAALAAAVRVPSPVLG